MTHTAEEVRKMSEYCREHFDQAALPGMLTAYAALLERRAAGVTDEVVDKAFVAAGRVAGESRPWLARHSIRAALLAVWPVAAEPAQLREAIRAMAQMLENHEWAELSGRMARRAIDAEARLAAADALLQKIQQYLPGYCVGLTAELKTYLQGAGES